MYPTLAAPCATNASSSLFLASLAARSRLTALATPCAPARSLASSSPSASAWRAHPRVLLPRPSALGARSVSTSAGAKASASTLLAMASRPAPRPTTSADGSRAASSTPSSSSSNTPSVSAAALASAPPLVLPPSSLLQLLPAHPKAGDAAGRGASAHDVVLLDATWYMPNLVPARDGYDEWRRAGPRLPGAHFWDLDHVAEGHELGLRHMMPSAQRFAEEAAKRGIRPSTHVVVYDVHGVFSSPRLAFTFAAFGHPGGVSVLDGGLPGWLEAGGEIEAGPVEDVDRGVRSGTVRAEYPTPKLKSSWVRSYDEMVANARMGGRGQTVLDARPRARYDGTAPEPRPNLPSGHIPSSLSLPFTQLLTSRELSPRHRDAAARAGGGSEAPRLAERYTTLSEQTAQWRSWRDALGGEAESVEQLRHDASSVDDERVGVTASCGSGMTAGVVWLSAATLGIKAAIYDESWTGWAMRKESPIDRTEVEEEEE